MAKKSDPSPLPGVNSLTPYERVEQSFLNNGDRPAVYVDEAVHTYDDLRMEVERIAGALVAHGCGHGARICLAVTHGVKLIACVLAVLKVRATYVPIDLRNPKSRNQFILDDCGAALILHTSDQADAVLDFTTPRICCDTIADVIEPGHFPRPLPNDVAYILYTSGSTGQPKGVAVSNSNLKNYSEWAASRYFDSRDDCIALYTTLAFDFTVTCIFPPLIEGASISVFDGINNLFAIKQILADSRVSILKITPAYLAVMSQLLEEPTALRRVIVGGENLATALARTVQKQLGARAEIINEYGPTEATVGCLFHVFDPATDLGASVPIGVPISGMNADVIDMNGSLLDDGVRGELLVSGKSVGLGYVNLDQRTQASFHSDPTDLQNRSYRTGDIVMRESNGVYLFFGRKDDQVKVRGHRIELAEISAGLLSFPGVTNAYVTTIPDQGSRSLLAAVTCDTPITVHQIRDGLEKVLPPYMIPGLLKILDALPLNANQKVDRPAVISLVTEGRVTYGS